MYRGTCTLVWPHPLRILFMLLHPALNRHYRSQRYRCTHEVTVCLPCRLVNAHTSDHDSFCQYTEHFGFNPTVRLFIILLRIITYCACAKHSFELFPHPRQVNYFCQTNYPYLRLYVHADNSDHNCFYQWTYCCIEQDRNSKIVSKWLPNVSFR